ncbi:MAG: SpoIIE family protein phosphatase [Cytophagales bacterium]|nr:SpoIIE family protein phosphatase [Cytophagales bacterium]MDW8384202.1 two-component regulator propeller domain-containing protein [Flammeovirgaceae bacterium]
MKLPFWEIILGGIFALSHTATGQVYFFKKVTIKDGLAENESRCILKDHLGFLWIGSANEGISRYDGKNMTLYNTRNGLSNNQIFSLLQDSKTNLWVGTGNGITRIYGKEIQTYLVQKKENNTSKYVALGYDSAHRLWFCPQEGAVGYIQNDVITYLRNERASIMSKTCMLIDKKNRIWIGTQSEGLFLIDGKKSRFFNAQSGLPETFIHCITEYQNQIYIGTEVGVFKIENLKVVPLKARHLPEKFPVYKIFVDKQDRMWLGSARGVYCLDHNYTKFLSDRNGLDGSITDILEDNENGIWFCSTLGLYRLNHEAFLTYTKENGLSDNSIHSILIDKSHNIWVCNGNSINVIQKDGNIISPLLPKPLMENTSKMTMYQNGILFTAPTGLYLLKNGKFTFFADKVSSLKPREYKTIYFDEVSQRVYLSSQYGIVYFDGTQFYSYLKPEDIAGATATAFLTDKYGKLWIGTDKSGIFIYQDDIFYKQLTAIEGLIGEKINDMAIDDSVVWVATLGNSLCKISIHDFETTCYEEINVSSSNIRSVVVDKNHHIWVGTDRGLDKVYIWNNDQLEVINYTNDEGFLPLEVNRQAMVYDGIDELWIGTNEGITKFDMSKRISIKKPPTTYIINVRLFFEPIEWEEYTENHKNWLNLPPYFKLPHDKNNLTFDFVGLTFDRSDKIQYRWKLEGVDKDWVPATYRNEAVYTNISPGNYVFYVKSCSADGVWSDKPASIEFEITKPFYQTRFFYVVVFIISAIGIYIYLKFRIRYLERKQAELALKVRERTTEIEKQKEHIQAQTLKLEQVLKEIDIKNKELIEYTTELTSSLEYGRKIQNAIFAYHTDLVKFFPNSFVLQIPKKIVFGDFLFVRYLSNHRLMIAVGDCTGSGVPAAFITLISNDFINKILNEDDSISADTVLLKLDKDIKNILQHASSENLNDGLDMGVCIIELSTGKLEYAGARVPLTIVKKNGVEETLKGNFTSIGISFTGVSPEFDVQTVYLEEGTFIYLYSDGFPNQFGGLKNEKYKSARFRKLLSRISRMKPETQHNILFDEFTEWRGNEPQIDDVIVVGFRFDGNISKP